MRLRTPALAAAISALMFASLLATPPANAAGPTTPDTFTSAQLDSALLTQGDLPGMRARIGVMVARSLTSAGDAACTKITNLYPRAVNPRAESVTVFALPNGEDELYGGFEDLRVTTGAVAAKNQVAIVREALTRCRSVVSHITRDGKKTTATTTISALASPRIGSDSTAVQLRWSEFGIRYVQDITVSAVNRLVVVSARTASSASHTADVTFARLAAGKAAKVLLHAKVAGGVVPKAHGLILADDNQIQLATLLTVQGKGLTYSSADGTAAGDRLMDGEFTVVSDQPSCDRLLGTAGVDVTAKSARYAVFPATGTGAIRWATTLGIVFRSATDAEAVTSAQLADFATCQAFSANDDQGATVLSGTAAEPKITPTGDQSGAFDVALSDGSAIQLSALRVGNLVTLFVVTGKTATAVSSLGASLRADASDQLTYLQHVLGN